MHRLAHLPKLERKTPQGPGVPIPGLATVFRSLSADGEPAQVPVLVEVKNFDLRYPAFVFEFRNANGILDFPDGNLRLIGADGTLGGAPARVSALWNRAQDRVSVEIAYADGPAPPRLHAFCGIHVPYLGPGRFSDSERAPRRLPDRRTPWPGVRERAQSRVFGGPGNAGAGAGYGPGPTRYRES